MITPRVEDVSDTAFLTAYARARETERQDALFRDPLAATLLTDRARAIGRSMEGAAMMGWSIVVRTVIIDDYIERAVSGGVDTVLNLGAGLDTRPWRMNLPTSLQWVEVDQRHMIDFKRARLERETPKCQLRQIGLDLTDVPRRRELFADVQSRARALLVVAEGLVPYLHEETVGVLADDLLALPSVRGWLVDYIPATVIAYRARQGDAAQLDRAPLLFAPDDWFAFFRRHGWRARDHRNPFDEGRRVGRPVPLPPSASGRYPSTPEAVAPSPSGASNALPGYVLLEPAR